MSMRDYFIGLARYHAWATEKILAEVALMSEADYRHDCGLFFKSVHGTLNHMLVGEWHWHARFAEGTSLKLPLNAELESDRGELASALRTAVGRWGEWVATMDVKRLDGTLHYTKASGAQVITPFAASLGHVFNHGTHHRGQISAALTAMRYRAPEMDLIYMLQAEMKQ